MQALFPVLCRAVGGRSEGVSRSYGSDYTYDYDDDDGLPLNPTRRIWSEHGEVHALSCSAVHTTQANAKHPGRQKTYLVALYTGVLSTEDAQQEWFIPYQRCKRTGPYHTLACKAQTHPLRADDLHEVDHAVQDAIEKAHEQGAGVAFFDDAPKVYHQRTAPWSSMLHQDGLEGGPSATSPHTDAGVTITLHGTTSSTPQRLVNPGEDAEIFLPGHVDEFAVTCPDIGDLKAIDIKVDRDGNDWSSSMWKLDRVVVTCLQSHKGEEMGESPRGEHVDISVRTANALQWHFVPAEKWIGPRPPSTLGREKNLETKLRDLEDLKKRITLLVSVWQVVKSSGCTCALSADPACWCGYRVALFLHVAILQLLLLLRTNIDPSLTLLLRDFSGGRSLTMSMN